MATWLVPSRSWPSYAIAICDRCHRKMPHYEMVPDPNSPGLRVHRHCADQFDPWRLPSRQMEKIAVTMARPDDSLVPNGPIGLGPDTP